jgi:hypothetical protein
VSEIFVHYRGFGKSVPRGIFAPTDEEVAEKWKELHNGGSITPILHKMLRLMN